MRRRTRNLVIGAAIAGGLAAGAYGLWRWQQGAVAPAPTGVRYAWLGNYGGADPARGGSPSTVLSWDDNPPTWRGVRLTGYKLYRDDGGHGMTEVAGILPPSMKSVAFGGHLTGVTLGVSAVYGTAESAITAVTIPSSPPAVPPVFPM